MTSAKAVSPAVRHPCAPQIGCQDFSALGGSGLPAFGATERDGSAFALGTMVWNVIFVECHPELPLFDPDGIDALIAPIGEAANTPWSPADTAERLQNAQNAAKYWMSMTDGTNLENGGLKLHPNAQFKIAVRNLGIVNTAVPSNKICREIFPRALFITDVLSRLGYAVDGRTIPVNPADPLLSARDRSFQALRNFNHASRLHAGANWATTIFFVRELFADGGRCFATLNGPGTWLTHLRSGRDAICHEMGHVLGARDRYTPEAKYQPLPTSPDDRGGYLNTVRGTIDDKCPPTLMKGSEWGTTLDAFTRGNVGIVDSDGDGVPDILSTRPVLQLSLTRPAPGTFQISGSATVGTIPNRNHLDKSIFHLSNSGNDITISWLVAAAYRLDHGPWIDLQPTDGGFRRYSIQLALSLSNLTGAHTLDLLVRDSVDQETIRCFSLNSSQP